MAEIHHLNHGWVTPTASYVLSVLGSLLGLVCAVRLRNSPTSGGRVWWLTLAAIAIGGTGIWTMHFVAMLGFSVVGSPIRYDVGLTAASAVIAVVAVGIGLAIATLGSRARRLRLLAGGLLAGLGVAAMHYTGMAAMNLDGEISYGTTRVALSVAIAVVAATVALWLTMTVQKPLIILVSAMIMGIAVNGMHFTGMSAMAVRATQPSGRLAGASATTLLIPIGLAVVFGILGLVYALMAAPTDEDRAGLAYMAAREADPTTGVTAPAPIGFGPVFGASPVPGTPPDSAPDSGTAVPPQEPAQGGIPGQRLPRRMPTSGSSWTYRDRAKK